MTATRNSAINAVAKATVNVISAAYNKQTVKEDYKIKDGKIFIKPACSSKDYLNVK